ncbi:MAG TPA: hypothetical protein VF855_04320 [Acidimicrobiales bacterium]
MGDIGEVWNAVKDTVTLFGSGHSQAMGQRAFACPQGMQPGQLDWSNQVERQVEWALDWTNYARSIGLSTGSRLRVGAVWQAGGTAQGRAGLYLHDAYLYAILEYSAAGTNYTVTGAFGDAVPIGNSAELSGQIIMSYTQFGMHMEERQFDLRLRGNGSGYIRPL